MSAERLREAATKLRRLAESATPGPWVVDVRGVLEASDDVRTILGHIANGGGEGKANAALIAAMHPAVGLAVADWLDGAGIALGAREDDEWFDLDDAPISPEDTFAIGSALDVADAILGGAK